MQTFCKGSKCASVVVKYDDSNILYTHTSFHPPITLDAESIKEKQYIVCTYELKSGINSEEYEQLIGCRSTKNPPGGGMETPYTLIYDQISCLYRAPPFTIISIKCGDCCKEDELRFELPYYPFFKCIPLPPIAKRINTIEQGLKKF